MTIDELLLALLFEVQGLMFKVWRLVVG